MELSVIERLFYKKAIFLTFARSRCRLRIERIWILWRKPYWGGRMQKLVFSPLLVSSVVLLSKIHLGVHVLLYLHHCKNK